MWKWVPHNFFSLGLGYVFFSMVSRVASDEGSGFYWILNLSSDVDCESLPAPGLNE